MSEEKVNRALREFVKNRLRVQAFVGIVKTVNSQLFTCSIEPVNGGPTYNGVRLKPVIDRDDHGITCIPIVGSHVLFGILNNDDKIPYIIQFTRVESYFIKTANGATLLLKKDGTIELNGDSFGGLVKVQELTDRLNVLEDAFNSHVHAGVVSGVGSSAPPITPVANTTRTQLENTRVKH